MDFRPQFVELNGDGLVDIIILEPRFSDLWLEHFDPTPDAWIGEPNSSAWIQNADGSGWTRAPDFDLPFPHIKSLQIKAKAFSISGVGGMLSFDAGVYFVDLNRDGLTDIAHDDWIANERSGGLNSAHGSAGVLLNTGTGWCNDQGIVGHDHDAVTPLVVPDCDGPNEANATSRYVPPIAFNRYTDFGGLEDTATSRPEQLVFVDVNGDGWVDLLQGKNEPRGTDNVRKAWLHDPSASLSVWVDRSVDFKPPTPFYPGTQFVDLDGNGTIDILHGWLLFINTSAAFVADAYLSPGTNSDLLASVENGRGGLTEFTYTNAVAQRFQTLEDDAEARAGALGDADGSSETVTRFESKSVVAETKVSGVGIADNVVTKYRYGRPRFDPIERSGLGFGLIETTNPDSSRVDAYYYQREGLVGRPALQETFDKTGSQLHTSGQTWVLAANLGSIPGAMDGVHVARSSNQFSFNVYAVENGPLNSTENGALNISSSSYDDAHGYNFVSQITTTRATGTLSTRFEPKDAHQPDWLVGMVAEKKQIANGITYSREEYDYTLKGQIKERRRDIGLRDTNAASDVATTSWIYDDKGNVTSQTETRGKDAAGNLLANPTRTVSFCYDGDGGGGSWCPKLPKGTPATHSLRVGITDAIGGVTKLEYDWSTGAVLHVERFNEGGAFRDSITVMRDAFRRNIELWFRGASFAQGDLDVQLATTVYHDAPIGNTPAFVEKFQITGEVGGAPIRTATYLDGFGNRLRSVEETPSGYRGIAVFRDPVTRIVRTTGPIVCTDLGASCSNITIATDPATEREVDAAGRIIRITSPDGDVATVYSRMQRPQPPGFGTADVFDAIESSNSNHQMTRRLMDGNRVVWVDECIDANCINTPDSTFYSYEPTGEISTIYDAIATSTGDYASPARYLRYHYDTVGRVIQTDEPNTGAGYAEYDHQANVIRTTNVRGATTLTYYDALGRVSTIDRPAGVGEWDLDFTYDPISRRRETVSTAESVYSDAWEYDDYGRVKRQTRSYNDTLVMDFEYDLLGRRTKIYYPSNDSSVSYVYQEAYLKQVCRGDDFCASTPLQDMLISDVVYDDLGRRTDTVTSQGTLHREYYGTTPVLGGSVNALKRLAITAGNAAGALDFNYEYDSIGNITKILDQSTTYDATATYTYDARNRLASWKDANNPTKFYTYDKLGNLEGHGVGALNGTNQTFATATKPHRITRNRLLEDYAYDPDGNVIQRGLTEFFVYDSANRLVCTGGGPGLCDGPGYRYDADGQLMWDGAAGQLLMGELFKWQSSGSVAYSNVAAFGEVIAQVRQNRIQLRVAWVPAAWPLPILKGPFLWMLAGAGVFSVIALLAWLGAGSAFSEAPATAMFALALTAIVAVPPPVWGNKGGGGRKSPGATTKVRVVFRDHLGSVAYLTGPNVRQAYEPFGKALITAADVKNEFTTKEYHGATDMNYFGARWYDAEAGRFAGVDPLVARPSDPQELNAYGYVRNDPVNLVDPTGKFTLCTPFGGVCIGRGGVGYHSNVPGGFQPFAANWITFDAGMGRMTASPLAFSDLAQSQGLDSSPFGGPRLKNETTLSLDLFFKTGDSEYTLTHFKSPQSVTGAFGVPVVPGAGSVRGELFIAAKSALGLAGDARGFDVAPNPSSSRAFFTLDFESGEGTFQINPTCVAGGDSCNSALPIGAGNTFGASISGNSVTVMGSLKNSKTPIGPRIDFSIRFSASSGGVTFSGSRNAFPSLELTRGSTFLYKGAETHPLRLFDATGMVRFSGP